MRKCNENKDLANLIWKMIASQGCCMAKEFIKAEVNSKGNTRLTIAYPFKHYLTRMLNGASVEYQGNRLKTDEWIYEASVKLDPESITRLLKLNYGG